MCGDDRGADPRTALKGSCRGTACALGWARYKSNVRFVLMSKLAKNMDANAPALVDTGKSPFVIEYLMVMSSGLRHMAYMDDAGKWRDAYNRRELPGPVKVLG